MFLTDSDNTRRVRELISTSEHIDLGVAFLGDEAVRILQRAKSSRVICNLSSGGTNPNAVKRIREFNNIDIRSNDLLHAKVYLTRNEAIITSANLSANGLGLEEDEIATWQEAGMLVRDKEELARIQSWFEGLWAKSKYITDDDIENALSVWKKRRRNRPVTSNQNSLLKTLQHNPESLRNRNIYLVISTDAMSEEGIETLKDIKRRKKYGHNVDAYENWSDLPEDSFFVDVYVGPRGGFEYYGLYQSPEQKILITFPDDEGEDETLFLCFKIEQCFGLSITKEDISLLRSKCNEILSSDIGVGDSDGKYIMLEELSDILFSSS